jgi:hypothetical protein
VTSTHPSLVSAHVGGRAAPVAAIEGAQESLGAKIDQLAHVVADLDKASRWATGAIEVAAEKGRTRSTAVTALEELCRGRAELGEESVRRSVTGKGCQIEH